MSFLKFIIFCLSIIGFTSQSVAQEEINFTSLTTKDGLSSNNINVILKDRYGLMWFGTDDGLAKFNGISFTIYRKNPSDSLSLPANEILAIHEDYKGNLWIGTSGGSLCLYDRKKDAFIPFPANGGPNTIDNNVVQSIYSDYLGKIWIGHYTGINILDPVTRHVEKFPLYTASGSELTVSINAIFEDSQHRIWIGTFEGLFEFDPKNRLLIHFLHSNEKPNSLSNNHVKAITQNKYGNICLATLDGLSILNPKTNEFTNYKSTDNGGNSLSSNFINSIAVDGDSLWLGTSESLDILNIKTGQIRKFNLDYRENHSLTAKSVQSVYIDRQGVYWVGTIRGGVDKYDKNLNLFSYVQSNVFDQQGLNSSIVTAFAEDRNGNVYVGTDGHGFSLFDRKTKLFKHFNIQPQRSNIKGRLVILAMAMTRSKNLIIGTFSDGLFVFFPTSGTYKQLMQGTNAEDLNSNDVFCIKEDHKGNIWLGTNGGGVNVLSPENEVILRYTPNPTFANDIKLPVNGYIRDIEEDNENNFWIATHGGGIAMLEPASQKFTIYNAQNSNLPTNKVQSLLVDSKGNLWVGTFGGGLCLFNKETKKFSIFSEKSGLQNSTIYKILEDKNGRIWVSTNKSISSLDMVTKKINNYTHHNGVQNNNFVHGAGLRTTDGELFFGGLDGFNYFSPMHLKRNKNIPPVVLTDLRVSNQSVHPSAKGPISEHISVAQKIDLDYKQSFSLSFVGLSYTAPEQNQYAYKLEGFDKDWNYIGNSNTATYTNLDPGQYTFRVKASNNDGVWNNEGTSIKVYVHPPFWRTTYAYVLYAFMLTGLFLYYRHKSHQKIRRKYLLEQEKLHNEQERKETERVRELDRLKIKFFTNLSHEFRTPISLILGPVDKMLTISEGNAYHSQLNMVKRNARRLLNLVNQLLDFRKMEERELQLNETQGELVSFVKEVSDSFRDLSERKKINFSFTSSIDQLHTKFDHDKIERVLFNLLSNAFKFTLEGGQISLILDRDYLKSDQSKTWISIKVGDTGIGIPENQRDKIFEHFFQHTTAASILNQGTGIGLAITKEFVKLHGGTIDVQSASGKGSTFTIHMPFIETIPIQDSNQSIEEEQEEKIKAEVVNESASENTEEAIADEKEKPTILLVEDNEDFRLFLKDDLSLHYKVLEAANGKEGWQRALANHPELIVSDISMPYMDGIELTRKIKSDKRTAHIPIILLTALTGEEDQIKGLETGANDYIIKPFNYEMLNAKIKNLLVLNSTLKHTYIKQIKVLGPEVKVESADEKLLYDISVYLEENLTDAQLSVENLSQHVGMSRSYLYIKLLELTGQTPVEYIRSVKLEKAAVLLEKSAMNVTQVAYSVGFGTPNYFAKSFKAKYGMLPSEYLNKKRKTNE